ncbi:MAG: hypothetical protein ACRD3V_04140 [Vicinamibacteria bacterium]
MSFSLLHGLEIPMLALGITGLVAGLRNWRRWSGLFLPLWFLTFYAAAAVTPHEIRALRATRRAAPLLGAALFIESLPVRRAAKLLLVLTASLPSLLDSIDFDRVLGREDTRFLAASWIAENLPRGTPILVSEGYGAPTIPPDYPIRKVAFRAGAVREGEEQGFTHLVTHEHPALQRFSRIDESLKRRLETAVLLKRFDPFRERVSPGLFDELDAFYVPYQRPGSVERPGPVVSIWRLEP